MKLNSIHPVLNLIVYYLPLFTSSTLAEDLLDQYVKHVELVSGYRNFDKTKNLDNLRTANVRNAEQNNRRNSVNSEEVNINEYKSEEIHNNFNDEVRDEINRVKREAVSDINWTHTAILDNQGNVVMKWQPRHQEILFRVEAKTLGYIGIGFSPNGGMEGADIVIGYVKDDKAFLMDCHGVPKSQGSAPVRDDVDNYTLMRGYQNDSHTVIEFRRMLDTCDVDDYILTADTVRVIWSYHQSDPRFPGEMIFHEEKRGAQSLHLLGPPPLPTQNRAILRSWDVELKNFKIPNNMDTIYWCKVFKAPTLNDKHHITGFEPIIGSKHEKMVHHMIMHECELDNNPNFELWERYSKEEGQFCYSNMPVDWEKCLTPLVAWAIGSKGENFPNHIGLPLAKKKNTFYMLEVHFDNPTMKTAIDTSGLRLHYTSALRQNEGGILITGVAPSTLHFIPPFQNEYRTAGYCSLGCTKEVFPKEGINVISVMLHSHLAGRKLKLRHIRGDKELPPLAEDNHYDFNYQQSRSLSQDTTILPGDGLITECTYSTKGRNKPTLGGYSTREEMCLAFVLHYPRTELAGCYSIPPVKYFFENLGVKEFYDRNMTTIEQALLEGKVEADNLPSTTSKPFEYKPGDELSPEANMRAIMALKNAKEYSIDGESTEQNLFDKLIIKEPLEFRNKSFMEHLQSIPYNETVLTRKMEEYFYNGLHLTFCRRRDDTLAIKENIEKLPFFQPYEVKASIMCSSKSKRASSGSQKIKTLNILAVLVVCVKLLY